MRRPMMLRNSPLTSNGVLAVVALSLLLGGCATVVVGSDGWVTLGTLTVNPRGDVDVIRPSKAADYRQLKFSVSRAAIILNDVKVHFVNGQVQDVTLRRRINAGESTRSIDLKGGDRHIEKITLRYRTPRGVKRAAVVTAKARP